MTSHRQHKVSETIRSILGELLAKGNLPPRFDESTQSWKSLPVSVTITHVKVTPDLKHATVLVMPLGGQLIEETLFYLKTAKGFIRHFLSKNLTLRTVPDLSFQLDATFEASKAVDSLLQKIPPSSDSFD